MERITIKEIFAAPEKFADCEITVAGWARTIRSSNVFGFIELNDGSYFSNLQIVVESESWTPSGPDEIKRCLEYLNKRDAAK